MVRPTLLPSAALYLLTTAATTAASPLSTTSSSPSSNLLDYAVSAGTSPTFSTSGGSCGASVSSGAWLSLPGAHIDHRAAGSVDCGVGLALRGLPTGYRFSVSRAEVKGYLDLEDGCYLEKVEVRVAGGASTSTATSRNAYGGSGKGYEGTFDVSLDLSGGRAVSSCIDSSSTSMTLSIELFLSLAHGQIAFDDSTPHYGTIGGDGDRQVRVSLRADWERC